ncbi:MAG TPA: response regulator [Bacteroidia bacterium]|nr:response regulator [Bacteroidia bacterium]
MIKVLVVDDEKDVEFLFKLQFRKELRAEKIEMHFAFSGEEALVFMKTLNPFDLVLLMSDINMPGMTGIELIKATKQLFPHLKVVMITAYNDEYNRAAAARNGADGFLSKPVDFDTLKELIFTDKSLQ